MEYRTSQEKRNVQNGDRQTGGKEKRVREADRTHRSGAGGEHNMGTEEEKPQTQGQRDRSKCRGRRLIPGRRGSTRKGDREAEGRRRTQEKTEEKA